MHGRVTGKHLIDKSFRDELLEDVTERGEEACPLQDRMMVLISHGSFQFLLFKIQFPPGPLILASKGTLLTTPFCDSFLDLILCGAICIELGKDCRA